MQVQGPALLSGLLRRLTLKDNRVEAMFLQHTCCSQASQTTPNDSNVLLGAATASIARQSPDVAVAVAVAAPKGKPAKNTSLQVMCRERRHSKLPRHHKFLEI